MAMGRSFGKRIVSTLNLILWLAFLTVLVIAYTPLTAYMLKPLEVKEDIRKADVIVVLSGGIDKGRYLSLVSSHRMVRGAFVFLNSGSMPSMTSDPSGGSPDSPQDPQDPDTADDGSLKGRYFFCEASIR